jgi:ABC-type Fe3+ transport system substrate-binding protein
MKLTMLPTAPVTHVAAVALAAWILASWPGAVHAATVAEIANLQGPTREQTLIEGAKQEGKVVIYSAMIEDQALRPITQAFHKKYPFIEPEFWRADSRDLINKVLAEARAHAVAADIVEGGGVSQALIKAGVLQSFSTPALAPFAKERFDSKGFWAATRVSYFGLAYNTKLLKAEEAPKTYEDLLDPKFKGKLCWASTTETGGALMFITFIRRAFGEEKGESYLKALSKQKVDNLTGSPREVVNKVMQGECTIALDIFLHHPIISSQKGAPTDARALEPVLSNASVVTLTKATSHPHAAMLLIDYLLSKEAQQVLEQADYLPAHPDVPPQKSLGRIVPSMAHLEEIFLSEEFMFENRAKSLELQKRYFQSQ